MSSRDKAFAFRVEIDGIVRAAFKECSELSMDVGVLQIREGGTLVAEKEAGLVTFPDITLKTGRINDRSFYEWMKEVINVASGLASAIGTDYQRSLDVVQLDRDGSEIRRYRVTQAWPNLRKIGPWDNDKEEFIMEELKLAYKFWDEV
jgi:phage tail-like protein